MPLYPNRNRIVILTKCCFYIGTLPHLTNSILVSASLFALAVYFQIPAQVEYGIAAGYPNDIGIDGHPDVVFTEDFEEASISDMQGRWSDEGEVQRGEYMAFSDDVPAYSGGNQSLTAPGNEEGPGLYRRLTGEGTGYTCLYLRFYGKLDVACDEIHHYSWIGGHNPSTRWPNPRAGNKPAGDSHFSSGAEPGAEGWDFYTYWKGMGCWGSENGECHGNSFLWENPKPEVKKGEWFCWEMMIKVNDPPDSSNGEQAFWINGVKYAHFGPGFPNYAYTGTDRWGEDANGSPWPGFQWRTVEDLKVNYIWIYNYVHDDACRAWFDDVVAATSYIGPMVNDEQSMIPRQSSKKDNSGIFGIGIMPPGISTRRTFLFANTSGDPVRFTITSLSGKIISGPIDIHGISYTWNTQGNAPGIYCITAQCGCCFVSDYCFLTR